MKSIDIPDRMDDASYQAYIRGSEGKQFYYASNQIHLREVCCYLSRSGTFFPSRFIISSFSLLPSPFSLVPSPFSLLPSPLSSPLSPLPSPLSPLPSPPPSPLSPLPSPLSPLPSPLSPHHLYFRFTTYCHINSS